MDAIVFRTRFRPRINGEKFAFVNVGESMTQQQFKQECDVNHIINKYIKTGQITHLSKHKGNFGDFSNHEDYQTSLEKVMHAQEMFATLPSEVRNKFQNNPGELFTYLADPKNDEEAIKLGLKVKAPPPQPTVQQQMETALDNHQTKQEKKSKS